MGARLNPLHAVPRVVLRPVQPRDAAAIDGFVRALSPESRRRRFHGALNELPAELLERFTHPRPCDELGVLAFAIEAGREVCVGEARYAVDETALEGFSDAREFALVVADAWQGRGLGTLMLSRLLRHAQRRGVPRLFGDVLRDNLPMIALARSLGFSVNRHAADARLVRVSKMLDGARAPRPLLLPARPAAEWRGGI
jgi:RimJ/RimL family protein N-acetyltransferase